jgi:hypothetical protein
MCLMTDRKYSLAMDALRKSNLRFLLRDLGFGQTLPTMLFCDNKAASRHIDMRIHFCREHVELGDVATTFATKPDMVPDL